MRVHIASLRQAGTLPDWPTAPAPLLQVGPCTGIAAGDQLWMSRYILLRVAELYNVEVRGRAKVLSGCPDS